MPPLDHPAAVPLVSITVTGLLILIAEFRRRSGGGLSCGIALAGLGATAALSLPGTAPALGLPPVTGPGALFTILFSAAGILAAVFSRDYLRRMDADRGEYYLMIVLAVAGMILMALASDLVMLFLGLELMSICLYVLAGYLRMRDSAAEASLKYFLLGAFISGFLLYGIALVYGATGSLSIAVLVERLQTPGQTALFWAGVALLFGGFAFKVGAFPFHMWIPDVYQGAPTPVTGFMATGAKAAAFAVLLLLFSRRAAAGADLVGDAAALLAAGSMVVGNVLALAQQNVKRMLAYSSIAHAGYMLTGIAAGTATGADGVAYYLISYLFMNLGALGIVSILEGEKEDRLEYDDYAGLSARNPFLALLMTTFLFSLAGLPPFGGFFGKYFVFVAAIEAGLTWLAVLGVLASLAGVYYYLRLVMLMYFREGERPAASARGFAAAALIVAALVNVHLGVLPSSVISLIQSLR